MIDILNDHVSVRKYTSKPISETLMASILEAGCRASNTGNMQVYSIIDTTDTNIKESLAPAHFNQKMITSAPHVLTFCADFNRFKKWCIMSNAQPGYDNFMSFFTAAIDSLLVAQNVCIAAESKGLGICYLGTTIYNTDKIIEVLKLPKGVVPITTVTMGWPDEIPQRQDRLPIEAIVHHDTYHDYSNDDIAKLYEEKESLPENINFVKENKKETLAQIFTDIRYKKSDNELISEKLMAIIKQQFEF